MPFTRVSLLTGKPPEYLEALSNSLDQALTESFEVPANDRFVLINQLQPNEMIFDRTYRGGPRSNDFVHFHITTGRARSTTTQQTFYKRLTELLHTAPGIRPEDVMIVVSNSRECDWSFASGQTAARETGGDKS